MSQRSRRTFLTHSAAAVIAAPALAAAGAEARAARAHYICVTCAMQYAESDGPPERCPVCEDERQYVGWEGQKWTTLERMRGKFSNDFAVEEPGLHSIFTRPKIGIGQRAFLVQTPKGNLLWDCVPQIDEATVKAVKALGGLAGIAVTHPHYYNTMVEWSHALGKVPVYLHEADRKWAMRPDPVLEFWKGDSRDLFGGLKLVHTPGHFDGFQVLHWPAGMKGKGVLLSGDQPQVCRDRRWVTFMYSYPNYIPLPGKAVRKIMAALKPLAYERLYGGFPGLTVAADAKAAVERSAARYLKAIA